jgi:uncharacterized RDD family membrane protein YckC
MSDMRGGAGAATVEAPQAVIAGFWRRLAAALLDTILLGIAGWVIGLLFYDQLALIGPYGRAVGFPIALGYFGLFNSRLGGGATPGKRALGIRVVSRGGRTISPLRSIWRAVVYLLPFYLNGLDLSFLSLPPEQMLAAMSVDLLLIFGVVPATFYLYLANRSTRQVVHDLAAGTFVVRAADAELAVKKHIAGIHVVIVSIWMLIALAAVPVGLRYVGGDWKSWFESSFGASTDELANIRSAVSADPRFLSTNVTVSTTYIAPLNAPGTTTTYLVVAVVYRGSTDVPESVANSIAERVLKVSPGIMGKQQLTVEVRYGYDIGIATSWSSFKYSFSPDEWKARLRGEQAGSAA